MPLISCPDCGSQVSNQASACPKCARPIASPVATQSSGVDSSGLYGFGFILAWIIYAVRADSLGEGIVFGFFVAFLSWLYVGYALIVTIFR